MKLQKRKNFLTDTGGSVTIEFVLWAPILIFWMIGTLVFFDAFKARGHLSAANSVIADIVSRNDVVDQDYIDLLQLTQTSMLPQTSGNGLRVSTIEFVIDPNIPNDPGTYSVVWSAVAGASTIPLADADIIVESLPNMYDGEVIALVESSVPFVPMTAFLGVALKTLNSEVAISPRYESRIVFVP